MKDHSGNHANTVQSLRGSSIFKTYSDAFRKATGLPLFLQESDACQGCPCRVDASTGSFCGFLNRGKGEYRACRSTHRNLEAGALHKVRTSKCFAGLEETAVPIRVGETTVAFLKTGQVFTHQPSKDDFAKIAENLVDQGWKKKEIAVLEEAFFNMPVVNPERYQGAITLLAAFALQLAGLANRIIIEASQSEPEVIKKAKQFIITNIEEVLTLDMVAEHVNVSPYYFCKIFKQATGMTFTEYVNRRRVERAKRLLLQPRSRVTEVAFGSPKWKPSSGVDRPGHLGVCAARHQSRCHANVM
jgi:AraC-like DNA-binding protein/ligand-binding sensor protein